MVEWMHLIEELDQWSAQGKAATFWWRDDDAGADEESLRSLLLQRGRLDVPLALAVVPEWLDPAVAQMIREADDVVALQHGVSHADRTSGSRRRMELASEALASGLRQALIRSRKALLLSMRPTMIDVMVPPWNRIDDDVLSILPGCGFSGLSVCGPRHRQYQGGLLVNNVHIDIIDWKAGRRFAGEETCLRAAIGHLAKRRLDTVDPAEATGLMTHHLVHDGPCRAFIERFVGTTRDHPAAHWLSAEDVFGRGS